MEKKFTQGEWRVCLSNTSYADVVVDGFDICTCWSGYVGEDETKANAKLMAAAPELLEALIALVNGCLSDSESDKVVSLRKAKEVIKKATE